jgi:hypothetical protein
MQQESNKKTQNLAFGLIVVAAIIFGAYYLGFVKPTPSPQDMSPADMTEKAKADKAKANASSCGQGGGVAGADSPVAQVGQKLGAEIFMGDAPLKKQWPGAQNTGAGITTVQPGGLAAKSGMKDGDVIVFCNESRTTCPRTFLEAFNGLTPGAPVTLTVERAGKEVKLQLGGQGQKNAAASSATTETAAAQEDKPVLATENPVKK